MQIRAEVEKDWLAVKAVNESAFNRSAEADLVAELREKARPVTLWLQRIEAALSATSCFRPFCSRAIRN